jgi:hypothetical protein
MGVQLGEALHDGSLGNGRRFPQGFLITGYR